ncbi:hypothetical protein JR316_0013272 [Psilocybe cubensis]|uniref:Uncharacterized protein n=2 Tax=Psilocybe cubensis TaxID=181762 RepID=A0ACB8GH87_PSICU|nr:hypothetical protein JR316_0013272 [Psilocybe cubensis]KAH9474807.1 hypothetical protein JR316_0013272 [Psilocybe cubensis]
MFSPRPRHERYDLYTTAMIQFSTLLNPLARHSATAPLLGLFLVCNAVAVAGTPIQSGESISKRADQQISQGMTPKIWVPVVVAAIIIFVLTLLVWSKTSWRRSLRLFSFSGAAAVGGPVGGAANTGPRELTAEQLAGTINGDIPAAGGAAAAARTTRRPRRPRRTPSQMSVTSLPAYNKEPGEEELVIFRGRDAEDATMPTAVAMTSLDEERDESAFSHDNAERYSPMPASPHDMPLLQDDTLHGDLSLQSLPNVTPGEDGARPSADAGSQSSHETSSLMRTTSNLPDGLPDPRGNAPAYYEVVDPNEIQNNITDTRVARQPSTASRASRRAASPPDVNHTPGRRSGFRTLLNRMSMSSHHHAHNRNESVNSTFSSNISHGADPSNGNAGTSTSNHRTTPSGSGSLLSVNMFRTISRQRSNHTLNSNRLNSPSLISLNSISAPLTHTVTRSEFTYPKSGPTAEQLKVISSRESFARFGVPYGADAIAYASSSRLDLVPPPDFESSVEALVSPRSAGPSRLRAASNARRIPDAAAASTSPSGDNGESGISTNSTANNDPTSPSIPSASAPPPPSSDPVAASVPSAPQNAPSSSISKNHNSLSGQARAIPDAEAAVHDVNTAKSGTASSSKSTAASATQPVSEFGKLSAPPPSSYHELTASSVRSESRASVFTFATAQESLTGRARAGSVTDAEEYFTDADAGAGESEFGSAPSTPRLGGQHTLELTDATIVPDSNKRDTIVVSSAPGPSGSSTAQ